MTTELLRIVFVDQAGAVFEEVNLPAVPKVGDSVDIPGKGVGGEVDLITWRIPSGQLSWPSVIVRLKPHA